MGGEILSQKGTCKKKVREMSFRMQKRYIPLYMEFLRAHARSFLIIEKTDVEDGISSASTVF